MCNTNGVTNCRELLEVSQQNVWEYIFYDEAIKSKNRNRMGGETLRPQAPVTGICIALNYLGKHKKNMVIRSTELTGEQPAAIELTRRDHSIDTGLHYHFIGQKSPTFLKLRATSCAPTDVKGN